MDDVRYIAVWCTAGWSDEHEPKYAEQECKTLAAAKRVALTNARKYDEEWAKVELQEKRGLVWDCVRDYYWTAGGWNAESNGQ